MTATANPPKTPHATTEVRQPGSSWSIADAALRLGLCRATVGRACRDGRIKATRFGRRVTIADAELQRIVAEGF